MLCWNDGVAAFPKKWFNFSAFIIEGRAASHCRLFGFADPRASSGLFLPVLALCCLTKGFWEAEAVGTLTFCLFFLAQGAMSTLLPHLTPTEKPPSWRSPVSQGWSCSRERGLVLTSTEGVGGFWPNHNIINWKISTEMSEDKLRGLRLDFPALANLLKFPLKEK